MRNFCTYFDRNYLLRGLALYQSLKAHCRPFRLWVLCMDKASHAALAALNLRELQLIALEDFERGDAALQAAKNTRTAIEYYFTCTPSLPLFIFKNFPEIDDITYMDADLYFFSDVSPVYEEIGSASVAIIEHRFPPAKIKLRRNGIYNVGWLFFRRDKNAMACLNWWRDRCNEWCYDRVEDGRFADQKYLDDWPQRFQNVKTVQHKGANVAPWNLANYRVSADEDRVSIDDQPLVFFHFHGFRQLTRRIYDTGLGRYGARLEDIPRRSIFEPYLHTLLQIDTTLPTRGDADGALIGTIRPRRDVALIVKLYIKIKRLVLLFVRLFITKSYIVAPRY